MRVLIMGNGRVGSELSLALLEGGHDVTSAVRLGRELEEVWNR